MGDTVGAMIEAEVGLAELADASDALDAAVQRIQLQHQLAVLWFLHGRFGDLLQLGFRMVELAKELDQPRWLAWAQNVIGWAHTGAGRTRPAIEQYVLVLATAEIGGDKLDMAGAHANL
jgi:hypothetical protein